MGLEEKEVQVDLVPGEVEEILDFGRRDLGHARDGAAHLLDEEAPAFDGLVAVRGEVVLGQEEVVSPLVEDAVHLLKADIDRLESPGADPIQRARAGCETFFRFAQENRDLFRIVFGHGVTFHGVAHRAQELFVSGVATNLAAGMRASVFRPNRPDVVAQAFTGMLLQAVSWWIEQESVPVSEVTESLLEFAFHGLHVDRHAP
jgi:hypothetical protein